jgi:hypothetical protein
MGMVWEKGPRIAARFGFRQEIRKSSKKIIPIFIVPKYVPTLDPPNHNVVQDSWSVKAG